MHKTLDDGIILTNKELNFENLPQLTNPHGDSNGVKTHAILNFALFNSAQNTFATYQQLAFSAILLHTNR
jgi:hypothetical protein